MVLDTTPGWPWAVGRITLSAKSVPEHLGLELEQPVDQPDEAEADLDRPGGHPPRRRAAAWRCRRGCSCVPLDDRGQLGPGQVGLELVRGGQRGLGPHVEHEVGVRVVDPGGAGAAR